MYKIIYNLFKAYFKELLKLDNSNNIITKYDILVMDTSSYSSSEYNITSIFNTMNNSMTNTTTSTTNNNTNNSSSNNSSIHISQRIEPFHLNNREKIFENLVSAPPIILHLVCIRVYVYIFVYSTHVYIELYICNIHVYM